MSANAALFTLAGIPAVMLRDNAVRRGDHNVNPLHGFSQRRFVCKIARHVMDLSLMRVTNDRAFLANERGDIMPPLGELYRYL